MPLPSAIITPFSSVIVVSINYNLLLSCTGVGGTLSWYRGNRLGEPVPDMTTHLKENNTLVLNISGLVEGVMLLMKGYLISVLLVIHWMWHIAGLC